jgi:hypothetical protein
MVQGNVAAAELLDELIGRVNGLSPEQKKAVYDLVEAETGHMKWVPNPGPQVEAYFSEADELFYGGAAGGGKSSLICGAAIQQHKQSLILRRIAKNLKGIKREIQRITGSSRGLNEQLGVWKLPDDRVVDLGHCEHEKDKENYQGIAHDLKAFDEITQFTESQYRYIIGWNRSDDASQRCRVICTGNPPLTAEGLWVIKYWGPWLDPTHPKPAKPGELRWFTTIDDRDIELPNGNAITVGGEIVHPRSRTFIPSRVEDNPDYMRSGYASVLQAMPAELRRRLREGEFGASLQDGEFQVIPTAWILAAQERWSRDGWKGRPMTAMAFDPAGGGRDTAELCWRHDGWYGEFVSAQGKETADGSLAAAKIIQHRRDNAPVVVDAGGGAGHGFGGTTIMRLEDNAISVHPFNGASPSMARTKDGQLKFANKRAEAWWRFREELNPDQQGGSVIALPPDPELRADLAAPTYEVVGKGILIEDKAELRKRLGRSPGKADAVVMCLSEGNAAIKRAARQQGNRPTSYMGGGSADRARARHRSIRMSHTRPVERP